MDTLRSYIDSNSSANGPALSRFMDVYRLRSPSSACASSTSRASRSSPSSPSSCAYTSSSAKAPSGPAPSPPSAPPSGAEAAPASVSACSAWPDVSPAAGSALSVGAASEPHASSTASRPAIRSRNVIEVPFMTVDMSLHGGKAPPGPQSGNSSTRRGRGQRAIRPISETASAGAHRADPGHPAEPVQDHVGGALRVLPEVEMGEVLQDAQLGSRDDAGHVLRLIHVRAGSPRGGLMV